MRTGKIGLKAFLYRRDISDIEILFYNCNQMLETAVYLAIEYRKTTEKRRKLSIEIIISIYIRYDFDLVLKDLLMAKKVMK